MPDDSSTTRPRSWPGVLRSTAFARVVVVVVAVTLFCVEVPVAVDVYGIDVGTALVLGFGHTAAIPLSLWFARQAAMLSVAASTLMMLTVVGSDAGVWPWGVVPLLTQVTVLGVLGFVASGVVTALTLAGSIAASGGVALVAIPERPLGDSWANVMLFAGLAIMAAALGAVLRQASEIGVDLRRQREISAEEYARRLVVEEKSRVARELHDVIAHNMSLITVQARSAPHRLPGLAPEAAEEFTQIAARAADALGQMRGVLTVLRTEEGQSGLSPAPSVRQVPALVESVRSAGQQVDLTWRLPEEQVVPADVGASAYGIVQEALSNVRRHAAGATATVVVEVVDAEVLIRIDNPVPAATAADPPVAGHGLVGMRERAAAVGGRVEAGVAERDVFRVEARLPMRPARPGEADPA